MVGCEGEEQEGVADKIHASGAKFTNQSSIRISSKTDSPDDMPMADKSSLLQSFLSNEGTALNLTVCFDRFGL